MRLQIPRFSLNSSNSNISNGRHLLANTSISISTTTK